MKLIAKLRDSGWHFLDRLAVYSHPLMIDQDFEYWRGHRRKKIGTIGRLTFWVRY